MKVIVLLFCWLMNGGCNNEVVEQDSFVDSSKVDTSKVELIKDLYELQQSLTQIYATDSITQLELDGNKILIDSLIRRSLEYKDRELDIQLMRNQFDALSAKYKKQIDTLSKSNELLKFQNVIAQQKIEKQKREYDKLNRESLYLLDSLDLVMAVSVENIKFECIGSSLFDSEYITNKGSKVKYVKFSASIPKNKISGSYLLRVELFSTDKKDVLFNEEVVYYDGKEKNILFKLGAGASFKKGEHIARVFLSHKMIYETSLKII